jgi:hypothetical protein
MSQRTHQLAASANVVVVRAQIPRIGIRVSSRFEGLSDTELARVELDAELAIDGLEQAIGVRFDLVKAVSRYGTDRMADMAALLPLYDASDAARQRLARIRAEQVRRRAGASLWASVAGPAKRRVEHKETGLR